METVDLIEYIIGLMDTNISIQSKAIDGDGLINIESCNTRWLSNGCTIEIESKNFTVQNLILNKQFSLKPEIDGDDFTVEVIELKKPSYLHATLKMAKNEFNSEYQKEEYLPLIYLYEVIRDRKNNDDESMIDRESELRLFFLQSAKSQDWLTDDHYEELIKPMKQMVKEFEKQVKKSKFFTDVYNSECFNLVNISLQGNQSKSLFDCNLSGIELKMFSEIRKNLSCVNKCLN